MHTLSSTPSRLERKLGDTEASYFLPSRENGVNDMYVFTVPLPLRRVYLHLGFRASAFLMNRQSIALVWSILRIRHPLLASSVEMHDYEDVRFVYAPPSSPEDALKLAELNLEYRTQTKDELLHSYLNGPRTLSSNRLSYLILSQSETKEVTSDSDSDSGSESSSTTTETAKDLSEYDLLICATHFLGDGMALHSFANEFFSLLCSSDVKGLQDILSFEWQEQCYSRASDSLLPLPMEERLPESPSNLHRLASRVDFLNSQDKLIGGQAFPKKKSPERETVVPTVSFDEERTKKILKACKAHGVSISSALFAICNIAWAKTSGVKWELPMMMYSALNLRPYLSSPSRQLSDSYWFISIGYFNVILPTFIPKDDLTKTFWHRARSAKDQSSAAVKHPMLISRSRVMAQERGARARIWAKEDDEKAQGIWKPAQVTADSGSKPAPSSPRAPSTALIGLSLLGNLDGIYKHARYADITLHTLTTGSRQRPGGMLLFGYTFVGKLCVSLGYDKNGFKDGVVEQFWDNTLQCIDELLV
ncbi:hypothetical protein K435DRAFT_788427 [Dendrothele bispora CBS 962.96]|uniref:CoA-dependent acyltransferase n=1 Tax=Dendrothele bispora (strain CBS 962.96) TaxID=1314807 RepID=A0A4S8MW26_DENBC|nr:hypothetical protein K435DRAFT_788427 [Dendrothele bispora CBS 962.96]